MELQRETNIHGRWYNDACGTAFGLEVIGERWSLLVVRELMFGPLRFSDLRAALPGISAKVLTERLEGLEGAGILARRTTPPPTPARLYELTEWGYRAENMMMEIGRWAAMSSLHDPGLPVSPVSLMLSMRTMLDHSAAKEFDAVIGFDIGDQSFRAQLADGELAIQRGTFDDAQAVFHMPAAEVLGALLYAGTPWKELERDAGLVIEGDRALARRYAELFSLPEKVA